MIKVSVIVPVYNVSKYIKRCMDSLVNQTLDDIEFIIINDGTKDDSEEIIKTYKSDKIKYYKRANHGIGNTRNFGLKHANGEYIGFVDSDDYIECDMFEKLYNKAKQDNLDIVVCDFYRDNEESNTSSVDYINGFKNGNTNLKEQPDLINNINLSPWNKLYKRELIDVNSENFVETLKYEDAPFVIRMLDKAKMIGKIDKPLYHYMIHKNSETTIMDKRVFDMFEIYNIIYNEHKDKEYLKDSLEYLFVCGLSNYNLQQRNQKDKKLRYEFINRSFDYMNSHATTKNKKRYYKNVQFLRRLIEQSKFLTKLYCNLYIKFKRS